MKGCGRENTEEAEKHFKVCNRENSKKSAVEKPGKTVKHLRGKTEKNSLNPQSG